MHHQGAAGQSTAGNAGIALGVRNASKPKASRIALDPCPLKSSRAPCMVTVVNIPRIAVAKGNSGNAFAGLQLYRMRSEEQRKGAGAAADSYS